MDIKNIFFLILIFSSFYSFGMTLLAYSMPTETYSSLTEYNNYKDNINPETTETKLQESLTKIRTGIPLIDVAGSLLFFSGNILLDLILNFITAIPSFITMFINLFLSLFVVDVYILQTITTFIFVILSTAFIASLIFFIVGFFSRGG